MVRLPAGDRWRLLRLPLMSDFPPRRSAGRPPTGSSWTRPIVERLSPAVKALVIANALVYAAYVLVAPLRPFITAHLALGPGFLRGEVWQPLTALFVHRDLLAFVFDIIGIWFVGATLERIQGTRRLTIVFFVSGVLSNVATALVSHLRPFGAGDVFDGCSSAVLALFVAFGRIYGRTPAQIIGGLFLQARTIAIIFVVWAALASVARGDWATLAATIVTTIVGYLAAAPGGLREAWGSFKIRRLKRRYRVIDGGARKPPRNYLN